MLSFALIAAFLTSLFSSFFIKELGIGVFLLAFYINNIVMIFTYIVSPNVHFLSEEKQRERISPLPAQSDVKQPLIHLEQRGCRPVHCNENPIFVFPEKELRDLSPNFHIHSSQDKSTYFPAAD